MIDVSGMSNSAILSELGRRVQRERLNRNIAQADLAAKAGVSRRAVQHFEAGFGCTLGTLVRLLRALGRLDALDSFLPEPGLSPLQLAKLKGHPRQRSSRARHRQQPPEQPGLSPLKSVKPAKLDSRPRQRSSHARHRQHPPEQPGLSPAKPAELKDRSRTRASRAVHPKSPQGR